MLLLALLASGLLRLGSRPQRASCPAARHQPPLRERGSGLFQLAGFALALMLFGLLWAARVDLLEDFSARLPADAPEPLPWSTWPMRSATAFWPTQRAGAITSDFYPMVRGTPDQDSGGRPGRMRRGRGGQGAQSPTTTTTLPPTTR